MTQKKIERRGRKIDEWNTESPEAEMCTDETVIHNIGSIEEH